MVATPVVEESIDLDGLVDADMSEGSAVEKLTQAFPAPRWSTRPDRRT